VRHWVWDKIDLALLFAQAVVTGNYRTLGSIPGFILRVLTHRSWIEIADVIGIYIIAAEIRLIRDWRSFGVDGKFILTLNA